MESLQVDALTLGVGVRDLGSALVPALDSSISEKPEGVASDRFLPQNFHCPYPFLGARVARVPRDDDNVLASPLVGKVSVHLDHRVESVDDHVGLNCCFRPSICLGDPDLVTERRYDQLLNHHHRNGGDKSHQEIGAENSAEGEPRHPQRGEFVPLVETGNGEHCRQQGQNRTDVLAEVDGKKCGEIAKRHQRKRIFFLEELLDPGDAIDDDEEPEHREGAYDPGKDEIPDEIAIEGAEWEQTECPAEPVADHFRLTLIIRIIARVART